MALPVKISQVKQTVKLCNIVKLSSCALADSAKVVNKLSVACCFMDQGSRVHGVSYCSTQWEVFDGDQMESPLFTYQNKKKEVIKLFVMSDWQNLYRK